ncbi:hypothetical protein [Pyxidicoccus xibeiensis]|uniref:hypothetical protein n=1 Tax=Pyxidicoccus xibeiensis TaxID=2906759 RepID=UPI0020A71AE8|nr:hypothetical protein [Pyxidicoccus xibeiensis]MCP3142143.1 hypothetical protein [Pyxidicoccus xibeiensis]
MPTPLPLRPPPQRLPAFVVEGVCLLALLLACVKLGRGVEGVLDLGLWDEADYLHRAFLLPERGLPSAEWGPLYSLWYFALSWVWPDPVDLYYGNTRLLLLLTTVASHALLRSVGARPWHALAVASVYLLSMAPHVLPRPTLLALLVILVALSLAARARSAEAAGAGIGLGLLVASFARPEYFLAFLLVSALLGVLLARTAWKARARRREVARTGAAYALGALALLALLGNPFADTTHRRFYAFCQHFADNHVRSTGLAVNPWDQCEQVIRPVFGDVSSVGAAARANPGAFLSHLRLNLERYPRASLKLFTAGYGGVSPLPGRGPLKREHLGHLLLLAVAVGLPLGVLAWNARQWATALRRPRVLGLVAAALVVQLPALLSVVLIQPREHYLVIQGVLVLAVLAALASAVESGVETPPAPSPPEGVLEGPGGLMLSAVMAGVLVLSVPDLMKRQGTSSASAPAGRALLHRVQAIRSLGQGARVAPGESVAVLDSRGGLAVYLGVPYRRVPTWTKRADESLSTYLRRERIEVVFLNGTLREDPGFAKDPELESFLSEPGAFGYATRRIPGTDELLAVPEAWAVEKRPALSRPPPSVRGGAPPPGT